ncbi:cilia- and flagella-associated protein 58 [Selaginella moellendorffii]|uniref:cilia- and flagella-associated protein 58 n=1 Tax=Selaginella moellendorffii TaxID=88036 RepID=UPI000D1CB423|nr:cilia- and flagella-associated protein 58 [Selaginella moellendorffii]|eukprot:XP_024537837.1 cilia- and flagella-associated protein 58 [Selaginella moellendorffii]
MGDPYLVAAIPASIDRLAPHCPGAAAQEGLALAPKGIRLGEIRECERAERSIDLAMDSDGNLLADLVREPWVDGAEIEMEQAAMVEAWLDRLLVKILAAAAASFHGVNGGESQGFQSGLKRSGLDRKKLIESNGLEPRQVDLLYRGLYFHSIGMFRVLTELNLGEETAQKVMAAFKLLTSYLPKLEMEPIKYMGNGSSSNRARTKLEVSYMQLVQRTSAEKFARTEEKETFEAKIRELEANVLEKQQEIQSLRETVCERDQEIESCKKSLKDTKLANDALKAVMIRHEEELTRLQEECPDDLKELVRLREENELASKRLADIERQLRRTNDELEDAAFNTAELKKVKGINEKLTSMLATAEKDLNARTKLLNSANESMEKLDRDNYALNELYHEEAKRCAALRLQVQELLEEKEILTRSSMNAKLVAEVEALQKKVQQLLVENENYRSTLAAADKGEVQSLKAVIEGV